jgi:two-component system, OmpR family, KDP operon response regulator KdpE
MSAAPIKVLVIDDDFLSRELLRRKLKPQGYDVIEASSSKSAVELLAKQPSVVIMDPGYSDPLAHALLRMIRGWNYNVPVVVLSNRSDEAGIVQALDLGANDYITKPFSISELLARLRVALRHQLQSLGVSPLFRADGLTVDLVRRIVTADGKEINLSPKEYELLRIFVSHTGKVLTHKFLLGELWGNSTKVQYLRVHVRQLRQKIETDPERPKIILTESCIGYRLREAQQLSIQDRCA